MAGDPNSEARSAAVQAALSVVDLGTRAATAYQRPDLARRLGHTRERLLDPSFHVFVVGEYKQGKSSLVNALLNVPVCPVDDDIATSAPTAVRYAEEASAAVLLRPRGHDADAASDEPPEPVREQIPIDQVASYVTEASNPANERRVHAVEVGIPRKLLAGGLVLVDTPGVGGLGSPHTATTLGALPMADALILVSDASQELTAPELEFLQTALRMCPNVLCLVTKIDFYPAWRKIRDLNAEHLTGNGIEAPLICTSSALRFEALRTNDRVLNQESGFSELVSYLQGDIVANAEKLTARAAASDVAAVAGLLAAQFQNERQALRAPSSQRMVANLGELRAKATRLGSNLARWQQTLADGIADLSADIDYDLRGRLRQVGKEADEAIEVSDPAETWDEFEPWLRRRVSQEVVETYAILHRRSHELALRVGEHFEEDGEALTIRLDVMDPTRMVSEVEAKTEIDTSVMGRGEAAMASVRGAYMGVAMFGTLGGMLAGLTMLNPATAAIGLVMARKALRQEKDRQLTLRRNNAKTVHRKYADEVGFVVMKDARDTLRRVQRQLRDFYAARAEELQKTTNEALAAAQQATRSSVSAREKRLRDVNAELQRIAALRRKALELAPDLVAKTDSPAGPPLVGAAPSKGPSQ